MRKLIFWLACACVAQTRVSPDQIASTITVVEWGVCTAPSCVGMELYRFRMADGTLRGPFVGVPTTEAVATSAVWTKQPLKP